MQTITLYIGLDVHKDSIVIAIAEPGPKGEIRIFGTITNDLHALEKAPSHENHPRGIPAAAADAPVASGFHPQRHSRRTAGQHC
jgi:hypothetical protein